MTRVFKHMTPENAQRMSRGEIRIGSFSYYRDSEHHSSIRDELEGATLGRIEKAIITSDDYKETIVAGLKFVTDSGGVIDLSGASFIRTLPPLYIYSSSLVKSAGYFPQYNTVVCIEDIESFGRIIVDGRKDLFRGYYSGLVSYQDQIYDALHHPGIEPDPFIKDRNFEKDQEFRLVFLPVEDVKPHVTFVLDQIRDAFSTGLCTIISE